MRIIAITLGVIFSFAGSADAQTMDHSKMNHTAHMTAMADAQRKSEVSQRGEEVMPFSLAATTHIFTKNAEGGMQQVVAKKSTDADQVKLIRMRPGIPPCVTKPVATGAAATRKSHSHAVSAGA